VSRGGKNTKYFTTTNLVDHLQKHPAELEEAKKKAVNEL